MSRIVLIGHRGVGKTSLLKRIARETKEHAAEFYDLDLEIEKRFGKSVHAIFSESESDFRQLESETFSAIDRETQKSDFVYLAAGAGFDPALIPDTWQTWWVRRVTDASGRIFTDRPRLNQKISALDEYLERYEFRRQRYAARADRILYLDEGQDDCDDPAERAYLRDQIQDLGGTLTLLPDAFRTDLDTWLKLRLKWGIDRIELRDDLLSSDQMRKAASLLPIEKCLISFRLQDRIDETLALCKRQKFDWPLELGPCPSGGAEILSLHQRNERESISDALNRLTSVNANHYKAALPVRNFDELVAGYKWWQTDPKHRSFLPHSPDGRWAWYRRWIGRRQLLNFIREGDGSGVDQPTLLQWMREPREPENFAAVLGDPVQHSRTPLEQAAFFRERKAAVYAIRVTEAEMQAGALTQLQNLGLKWAAVTAPLKTQAFAACNKMSDDARVLGAVNTLQQRNGSWIGTNTDLEGLREAVRNLDLGRVAVWGGGGTLNVIRKTIPNAQFFSVRTGENRDGAANAESYNPDSVLWAVGRSRLETNAPPAAWKPKVIVDLNYAEDSLGRAFAVERGSQYVSGLSMFRAQAKAQRRFWLENEHGVQTYERR